MTVIEQAGTQPEVHNSLAKAEIFDDKIHH